MTASTEPEGRVLAGDVEEGMPRGVGDGSGLPDGKYFSDAEPYRF